jgi:hypothetical protein
MARVVERRGAYRDLVGKPEKCRSLLTYRSRWEDDISMDLKEKGWKDMDWIYPDQDTDKWWADVKAMVNLRFS